jgi:hypothetical protein
MVKKETHDFANSRCVLSLETNQSAIASIYQLGQLLTIIGTAHYPRQFMVEKDSSDIVKVAIEGEQTSACLI